MVSADEVVIGRCGDECRAAHRFLNDITHLEETALILKESAVYDFIGRIEDARHVTALFNSLEREGQTTELVKVGLEELQRVVEQVETLTGKGEALRVGEGILDGQTHVGHTELGLYRAILKIGRAHV